MKNNLFDFIEGVFLMFFPFVILVFFIVAFSGVQLKGRPIEVPGLAERHVISEEMRIEMNKYSGQPKIYEEKYREYRKFVDEGRAATDEFLASYSRNHPFGVKDLVKYNLWIVFFWWFYSLSVATRYLWQRRRPYFIMIGLFFGPALISIYAVYVFR